MQHAGHGVISLGPAAGSTLQFSLRRSIVPEVRRPDMRKLVLMVLSCAVCACVASAPPGPPPFDKGWRFLDGVAAGPSDEVEPPVVKTRIAAVYPIEARKQRLTGEVGLELTVDDDGRVVKAEVVQPLEP